MAVTDRGTNAAETLQPYVPRLLVSWLRETPEARHRQIEGTLAFVDISGFTQLTERLARKGKVGSEEISDTLDSCFEQLLSVAYDYGAGVVKWGGDAVLLLFTDDEHAARACRASWGMHRLLRLIGSLQTSAGRVRLRMSTGVHSGSFDFFLAGGLHRELVLTGPGADETIAMEATADAGETVVSLATAALLDPGLHGSVKRGGIVLARDPGAPSKRAGTIPDTAGLALDRFFSPAIRDHLLAEATEPEHRMVTAAFVEFRGVDDLLAQAGADAVADALDECLENVQDAAARHEVTIFDTDPAPGGGKIMLAAGAPRSAGRDEERMLRTLRRALDRPGTLPLRAGVNCGRVFADEFGPSYRRTYTVKGDAVNLAARLMGKAGPGEILAARAVVDRSRARFDVRPVAPFRVKGKAQPVEAVVVGALEESAGAAGADMPLVGREEELATLRTGLEAARRGEGSVIELAGEPGIGKSRLVEDICSAAAGTTLLKAAGEEYEASSAYFAVESPLRNLLGIGTGEALEARVRSAAPHLLPWLPLIAIPLDVEVPSTPETDLLGEKYRKAQLEQAVGQLLGAILHEPALLVAEDTHWMDEASLDLLRALARDVRSRPWLVLATRRPEGAPLVPDATEIELQPLDDDAVESLIRTATEHAPIPGHAARALAERAGGNPLFLTELVAGAATLDTEVLPDTVEALVTAQIDRLSPADRGLLRQASVLGRSFDETLLAGAVEQPPDEEAWGRLEDFLVRELKGLVRFRHALIRDAAYEGLPFRRRRELHGRAAETIERLADGDAEGEAAPLSLHFFHAQRFEPAWRYARIAGEHARGIYAHAEAADLYVRAIDAARHVRDVPLVEVAAVCEALGDSLASLGLFRRSGDAYRNARRRRRGDPVAEAALMLKEGWMAERDGRFPQALRWFSRGLRLLDGAEDTRSSAQRAHLLAGYATVRQMQGRSADAIRWCVAAIAAAELAGERKALAQAYYVMDWAYMELGRSDEAVSLPLALAIHEELGNLSDRAVVREMMGGFAYYEGRWDEAVELYSQARDDFEAVGASVLKVSETFNIAEIRCDQGRLVEAEPLLDEALRVGRSVGWSAMVALATRQLGSVAFRSGRFDEAIEQFGDARALFAGMGAQDELADTEGRLAECFLAIGDERGSPLALDALGRCRALGGKSVHIPMLLRVAGQAMLANGDRAGARSALEESVDVARERRAPFQVALTLDALARLGSLEGVPTGPLEAERDEILAELAVVALPPAPPEVAPDPS